MAEPVGAIEDPIPKIGYRFLETEAATRLPTDELGRSKFAENLVKLLVSENIESPYVFGLYGRWGAGKTWVAKQMEMRLGWEQYKYPTCWFEAWRYESEDNLLLPLCSAIQRKFKIDVREIDPSSRAQFEWLLRQGRSRLVEAIPKLFQKLMDAAVQSKTPWILGTLGTALLFGRFFPATSDWVRHIVDIAALLAFLGLVILSIRLRKGLLDGWADSLDSARSFFRKFIEAALKSSAGKKPLFVFVEDLDRCSPDAALKLLESIKRIALNSAEQLPVVFVLILDRDALVAAVQHRYGEGYGPTWAEDYLQKIIRYSVELPELSYQGMAQFFTGRNAEFHFEFDHPHLDQLAKMCVSGRLHNVRKLETVLQRFHLVDSIYKTKNPKYADFRYRVLFYLLLKEFRPDIHKRVMVDNNLLPRFVAAAKESVNAWYNEFAGQALTLEDAKDRDLGGLFHQLAAIEKIENEAEANRILRYALMIEGVGVRD